MTQEQIKALALQIAQLNDSQVCNINNREDENLPVLYHVDINISTGYSGLLQEVIDGLLMLKYLEDFTDCNSVLELENSSLRVGEKPKGTGRPSRP